MKQERCLSEEFLFDAAAGHELPASERDHLDECADCRRRVEELKAMLTPAREDVAAVIDRAVEDFVLPPLPEREVRRAFAPWRWLQRPIPAYATLLLLIVVAAPLALWKAPGRPVEVGGPKEVMSGVSSLDLLGALYNPDLSDANQVAASIHLLEEYAADHPNDASIHVKLVQLYEALLALDGWEDDVLTRAEAGQRLEEERSAAVRQLSPTLAPRADPR